MCTLGLLSFILVLMWGYVVLFAGRNVIALPFCEVILNNNFLSARALAIDHCQALKFLASSELHSPVNKYTDRCWLYGMCV